MPEIIRTRAPRYTDRDYSDDERGLYVNRAPRDRGYQTVQRYRIQRSPSPDRTSYRSRSQDRLENSRETRVQQVVERDIGRDDRRDDGYRGRHRDEGRYDRRDDRRDDRGVDTEIVYERQIEREPVREVIRGPEVRRTVVYERDSPRHSTRDVAYWEREDRRDDRSMGGWDREREEERQVIVTRTRERSPSPKYEMVTRETEYYSKPDPPPQPLVIRTRERAPESIHQRIIVEAPQPPPAQQIVIRDERPQYEVIHRNEIADNRELIRPEPRTQEVVYRRHEIRDSSSPEDDYVSERRYVRRDGDWSDGEYEDDHRYRRYGREGEGRYKSRSRSRSRSSSTHHKRHLAEGAAAGAAAGAILANHRSKSRRGDGKGAKAGQVVGGAALGALGAQVATKVLERRERSRHRRSPSRSPYRGRRRSESPGLSKKEKLGLGAALLGAALVGGKMMKDRNDRRAEEGRGRTRSRSVVRGASPDHRHLDEKHRNKSMARNAALAAGALAVANKVREHRSKSRGGRARSKSKRRVGAEMAAAALATAGATSLYERRKAKQEAKEEAAGISPTRGRSRSLGRSSRSRSRAMSAYSDGVYDRDMEPREYDEPLPPRETRSRSRSKVRNVLGGAAAATAAAVGVKKFRDRRERRKSIERDEELRGRSLSSSPDRYYDHRDSFDSLDYSPSPPRASGGAYYAPGTAPGAPASGPIPGPPVGGAPVVPPPGAFHQQTTTTGSSPGPYDMSGGVGPGLGGQPHVNPNYYDDRSRGDNPSDRLNDKYVAQQAALHELSSESDTSRSSSPDPERVILNHATLHPSLRNLAPIAATSVGPQHHGRRSASPTGHVSDFASDTEIVDERSRHRSSHRDGGRTEAARTPSTSFTSSLDRGLEPRRKVEKPSFLQRLDRKLRPGVMHHEPPIPRYRHERPRMSERRATSLAPEMNSTAHRRRHRSHSDSPSRSGGRRRAQSARSEGPTNKSVTFAPLSPKSSQALALAQSKRDSPEVSPDREVGRDRERGDGSTDSDSGTIEEVPRRFDERGRPIYDSDYDDDDGGRRGRKRGGGGGLSNRDGGGEAGDEMSGLVQKAIGVVEGKGDWKDLLKGVVEAASGSAGGDRKRRRH